MVWYIEKYLRLLIIEIFAEHTNDEKSLIEQLMVVKSRTKRYLNKIPVTIKGKKYLVRELQN